MLERVVSHSLVPLRECYTSCGTACDRGGDVDSWMRCRHMEGSPTPPASGCRGLEICLGNQLGAAGRTQGSERQSQGIKKLCKNPSRQSLVRE